MAKQSITLMRYHNYMSKSPKYASKVHYSYIQGSAEPEYYISKYKNDICTDCLGYSIIIDFYVMEIDTGDVLTQAQIKGYFKEAILEGEPRHYGPYMLNIGEDQKPGVYPS